MIRKEEVVKFGFISKFRGIQGEVELTFTDDPFDRGDIEYIVLDIDGILVPFFWEEYRYKNSDTAIFKLEDINNEEQAKKLVGRVAYYPLAHLVTDEEEGLSSLRALTGFSVTEARGGRLLGSVESVDDSSANVLLYIETPEGKELIIPYHDDFLVDYDLKQRTLELELPEGLLEALV